MFTTSFNLPDREMINYLSAPRLTGVSAAALPLPYFNEVVAENEIQLSVERHRG
jgi:hypothetical protein